MVSISQDIDIAHFFGGGVYAKETRIPAGQILLQHAHDFDHLSILASGEVAVTLPEGSEVFTGPACLTIKAGVVHQVQALTDVVWYCIHATNETDPEKVDTAIVKGY